MFKFAQSTKHEDLKCLYQRMSAIDDLISYNLTIQLPKKYVAWKRNHEEMISTLKSMIKEDLQIDGDELL